jgi:hypothetical protein
MKGGMSSFFSRSNLGKFVVCTDGIINALGLSNFRHDALYLRQHISRGSDEDVGDGDSDGDSEGCVEGCGCGS